MLAFLHRWDYCWKCKFDTDVKIENWWRTSQKKDAIVIFILQETKNYNLFDKSCYQENVKCHIQDDESWLGLTVTEEVNYK